jgi:cell division protease FtsH
MQKALIRLSTWFRLQPIAAQWALALAAVTLPAAGVYAVEQWRHQATLAAQAMEISARSGAEAPWSLNPNLPLTFGAGSLLGLLEQLPVDRVSVIYRPEALGNAHRLVLVESAGRLQVYAPSELEIQVLAGRAVHAAWGNKLVFIPRAELSAPWSARLEAVDQRLAAANARPGPAGWPAGPGGWISAALLLALVAWALLRLRGSRKALRFIEPHQVEGSLDDLVGMDDIKAEIGQICDQYRRRPAYAAYGIHKPFNVMFSGPPGTGKTKLAGYLAKALNLPILFQSAANLETGYVGGGAQTLERMAALARRRGRCIVFLDEAQDLFMQRGTHRKFDDDTQNMLLALLDGVRTHGEAEVLWIVASNFNSTQLRMDAAMLRRFQMKVDFRLPNRQERTAILRHSLDRRAAKVCPEIELQALVDLTEGCSPADLETIVHQAGLQAVRVAESIGTSTLMQAAERVLIGQAHTQPAEGRERDRRVVAVHEWGHFLVDFERERERCGGNWSRLHLELKTLKISLKANPRHNALGFVFHRPEAHLLKTRADIEHEVRVLLGGMANEELFFGERGTTNGAYNDITRATRLLHHAVAEMGMFRPTRLNFGALAAAGQGSAVDEESRCLMEAHSERLYQETRDLLARYRPLTEHLAGRLMAADEMDLPQTLEEIRRFESACLTFNTRLGLGPDQGPAA